MWFITSSALLYTYFLSPLASLPNAGILAPVSRLLWEFPAEYRGRITLDLPKLHRALGPLIRIGPNQVSFYSLEIYKAVHGPISLFFKDSRVYSQFVQDGHPALFSITKVPALTEMMLRQIDKWINCLAILDAKGPLNLGLVCRALESDILSTFAFGDAIGGIDSLETGEELAIYVNFQDLTGLWHLAAALIFRFSGWELSSVISSQRFDNWANAQLVAMKDSEKGSGLSFLKVMAGARMPEQTALSEAKEMLGPGTDTTSATLAHILYALSLNQIFRADLVTDLEASDWPTDMSALEAIPRLVAAVKEGIRWTGAAAAMLPRIVPRGGQLLAGKHLPEGTMISSSPIWYLRDEIAFPNPELYRPSRWLDPGKNEATSLRDEYYIPFSRGASTCIGNHFAYLELFLSLSQVLKRYSIHPGDQSTVTGPSHEAVLPSRREWVAAVPVHRLKVTPRERH
ncbi:cytochrome P450 [Aspergillus saccharolyticus JOP 1030-1]|uniref:Cytochrome P450 n=1 Tax=Aspergillus saccharolyticus JOP 1030-1 TaxID=1450539 RepID=A0A318ZEQ2_9EURO|nr:cytochrome P450 [Aspergillus saccharolyticus JOP 1030-1]PYH44754.1 cytochrome P450 [Aspergillus saccharolyticus JOP 1030-1]